MKNHLFLSSIQYRGIMLYYII